MLVKRITISYSVTTLRQMPEPEITELLDEWNRGEPEALQRLLPAVYDGLRRLANSQLHGKDALSLEPTELVHEIFFRIASVSKPAFRNRAHFFGAAAEMMRRTLVDLSRGRKAAKRGSTMLRVSLDEASAAPDSEYSLEELDHALESLAEVDPQPARLVELRFFGGLTVEEAAEVMGISTATAKREWRAARAFLLRELSRR